MRCLIATVLILLTATAAHAELAPGDTGICETTPDSGSAILGTGPWAPRPLLNAAYGVGESLYYAIGWEKIVAGHGSIAVEAETTIAAQTCLRIRSLVNSTPLFSTFFKVVDTVETFMHARDIHSMRFRKRLHEGGYKTHQWADFDREAGILVDHKNDSLSALPYVQDPLSLLYYVRTQPLEVGAEIIVPNFSGRKMTDVVVRVLRKERIAVKAGVFNTVVVEPDFDDAGVFRNKGRVTVWLTDDRLRLPVLMKSKVVVGSIFAELEDYTLGRPRRYQ